MMLSATATEEMEERIMKFPKPESGKEYKSNIGEVDSFHHSLCVCWKEEMSLEIMNPEYIFLTLQM